MSLWGIWELKKMAMRNLARHKVKTVLTSLAIMVSVALYIFMNSWLGGMAIESRRNIVNFEMGAAKLQTQLYFERKDEMPSYENFVDWEIYHEALSREGYVSAPRYVFSGTLFSTSGSAPILFHGIDPELERQTMRYIDRWEGSVNRRDEQYVDFGRWVQNGNFEIALGHIAAEKLRVGIPMRPLRLELEDLIAQITNNPSDAEFIRSMYDVARLGTGDIFSPEEKVTAGNERMALKADVPRADLDRYWDMVAATNRNDVRINAVIDIRAVPETIRADRFEVELMEMLRPQDRALVQNAYEYVNVMDAYLLMEENERQLDLVLDAMIRAGFSGAVRHVNQVMDVTVVGIINCPAPLPNGNTAYIPLDVLQDEAGMLLEGAVTELVIRERGASNDRMPTESESAAAITAALRRGLASMNRTLPENLAVHTWDEHMAEYLGYEQLQTAAPQVLVFLLFILSFLGISNTILLAILERTKETGMMRAMGMTDKQMIMVYMLEAGFLGLIGSILGMGLGCLINYPMVKYGIDFSAMAATMDGNIGFRTTGLFVSTWNIPIIFQSGIVATILSALVAILPTRKALKMRITDSLRFE